MRNSHEFNRVLDIQVGRKVITTVVRFKAYLSDITYVEERLDDKGKSYSNVCTINHKERGEMFILGNYEDLAELIFKEPVEKKSVGYHLEVPVKTDETPRSKRRARNSKPRSTGDT